MVYSRNRRNIFLIVLLIFVIIFSGVFTYIKKSDSFTNNHFNSTSACANLNSDFKSFYNMDMAKYSPEYLKCISYKREGIVAVFTIDKNKLQRLYKDFKLTGAVKASEYKSFGRYYPEGWDVSPADVMFMDEIRKYEPEKVMYVHNLGYFNTDNYLTFQLFWVPISDTQYKALISVQS